MNRAASARSNKQPMQIGGNQLYAMQPLPGLVEPQNSVQRNAATLPNSAGGVGTCGGSPSNQNRVATAAMHLNTLDSGASASAHNSSSLCSPTGQAMIRSRSGQRIFGTRRVRRRFVLVAARRCQSAMC